MDDAYPGLKTGVSSSEGSQQLEQKGLEQSQHEGNLLAAKKLLIEKGMPSRAIQKLTGLPEKVMSRRSRALLS